MGTQTTRTTEYHVANHMVEFDSRLLRRLDFFVPKKDNIVNQIYPHFDYGSFVTDWRGTEAGQQRSIEMCGENEEEQIKVLKEQQEAIKEFNDKNFKAYLAPKSFIHPYALVKFAGACGSERMVAPAFTYDAYNKRRFYEIDSFLQGPGGYAQNPTTTNLIHWGNDSEKNKTPYSFQDFIFCKWWNKIENNRLITLRRYAAPVTDNIEFADYVKNTDASTKSATPGFHNVKPWTPLATALTYFGEETGNNLSDILSFSASYNWKELGEDNKNPIDISSAQSDGGQELLNKSSPTLNIVTKGLGAITTFLGFLGTANGDQNAINLEGAPKNAPPDPYSDGPYMNRILGPVNVIMNTYRRERGLKFKQDINIKFEYVSRPIGGINNKAVLLDLLANMLVLTYSSGTWWGGMWRYRTDKPAVYPFKYGDAMNKLYRGDIFGQNGAIASLTRNVFNDGRNQLASFLPGLAEMASNIVSGFKDIAKNIMGALSGGDGSGTAEEKAAAAKQAAENLFNSVVNSGVGQGIQKVMAAKALQGATVPYISNQRALLTGEPVGDWHLTIGNPLNPIAMIGNLIVKDVKIKFSDELGPDDFPIGFEAIVTLDHGLGRDRDAIESMFNRGYGRIYTLSEAFRSSADGETKVDENTGGVNTKQGRVKYDETRNTMFASGTAFIAKTMQRSLKNTGSLWIDDEKTTSFGEKMITFESGIKRSAQVQATYWVNPWQMATNL